MSFTVRPSCRDDVDAIEQRLRDADRAEAEALGMVAHQALLMSFAASDKVFTVCLPDGIPAAMFGVGPADTDKMVGGVWMMATPEIRRYRIQFLRGCKVWLEKFHQTYPILWNYVDARNDLHIQWLKWLGCVFVNKRLINDLTFYEFIHI